MTWELLDKPGESPKAFQVSGDDAVKLFKEPSALRMRQACPGPRVR
jgi:hypothetical protein